MRERNAQMSPSLNQRRRRDPVEEGRTRPPTFGTEDRGEEEGEDAMRD